MIIETKYPLLQCIQIIDDIKLEFMNWTRRGTDGSSGYWSGDSQEHWTLPSRGPLGTGDQCELPQRGISVTNLNASSPAAAAWIRILITLLFLLLVSVCCCSPSHYRKIIKLGVQCLSLTCVHCTHTQHSHASLRTNLAVFVHFQSSLKVQQSTIWGKVATFNMEIIFLSLFNSKM